MEINQRSAITSEVTAELLRVEIPFNPKVCFPSLKDVRELISCITELFFPAFTASKRGSDEILMRILDILTPIADDEQISEAIRALPRIKEKLIQDARAIYEGDPAAYSMEEIILCYPGFYAILVYRIAHLLYTLSIPFLPRMISEVAHSRTGIDIHPGAKIGDRFCIDHGTGVVIGETARIGDRVKIYQGVTIGAKSFATDKDGRLIREIKRHPDIGNGCVIYANATILGGDTVIGDNSIIGGNVWLTHSVPNDSRVYYK